MTDLEIIKKCAEKMGIEIYSDGFIFDEHGHEYYPLTNDAQAMALVKKFPLQTWTAIYSCAGLYLQNQPFDLNRAIVECVSRLPD